MGGLTGVLGVSASLSVLIQLALLQDIAATLAGERDLSDGGSGSKRREVRRAA